MPNRIALGGRRVCVAFSLYRLMVWWRPCRVKEKLKSGERLVPGDEWPIFLYDRYTYDSEDPWNGAFRSSLLVKVRKLPILRNVWNRRYHFQPTSTYLLRQVRLTRNPKLLDLVMLASIIWLLSHPPQLLMLPLRFVVPIYGPWSNSYPFITLVIRSDSPFALPILFPDRHGDWLGDIL